MRLRNLFIFVCVREREGEWESGKREREREDAVKRVCVRAVEGAYVYMLSTDSTSVNATSITCLHTQAFYCKYISTVL